MISETPTTQAFMTANANREAFEGYNAEDIDRLSMSEYAKLTGRKLDIESVASAIVTQELVTDAVSDPEPLPDLNGLGLDVSEMTNAEYAMVRESLGMTGNKEYGVGILAGNDRAAWLEEASKKSGRTGLVNRGVIESPKIDMNSRFSKDDEPPTGRQSWYRGT